MLFYFVRRIYGKRKILDDVSFCFKSCGFYRICGESGSGKTTLLNSIFYNDVDSGNVYLGASIFYLPVEDFLVEEFTVKEMIDLYKEIYTNFKEWNNGFLVRYKKIKIRGEHSVCYPRFLLFVARICFYSFKGVLAKIL